jgi:hypothetical protein
MSHICSWSGEEGRNETWREDRRAFSSFPSRIASRSGRGLALGLLEGLLLSLLLALGFTVTFRRKSAVGAIERFFGDLVEYPLAEVSNFTGRTKINDIGDKSPQSTGLPA